MAVYYHLFKKTVTLKSGKQIKKWYYWYYSSDKTQVRKSCKGCVSKAEAQAYIDSLPPPAVCSATVSRIAKDMYIPGSVHYERRRQFGKSISPRTMLDCRAYVKYIIDVFGDRRIEDLRVSEIQQYLLNCNKSGSWKNRYQEIFCEIYDEAVWQGISVSKPTFIKFKRNSKRQSVLSTSELQYLFQVKNFSSEMFYLFFIVCLSAGMRLGEIRAFRVCQFLKKEQAILIDGFLSPDGTRNPFNKTGSLENPRYRVVLIPENICDILAKWIQQNIYSENDFVFTFNGKPVRQELAEKEFARALGKSGISTQNRKITPHALRYTYVTRTRHLVDTSTTMLMAGHSSEQMSNHYTQFELEETVQQLKPLIPQVNRFFS